MRANPIAPLHMTQGSMVTNKVLSSKRQLPSFSLASLMAMISACKIAFCCSSRALCPRPIISPSLTITQPIGISPLANDFCASLSASRIKYAFSSCVNADITSHLIAMICAARLNQQERLWHSVGFVLSVLASVLSHQCLLVELVGYVSKQGI